MSTVTSRITGQEYAADEWALRVDLAAIFRLAVHFNWHESIANHFSAAVSNDGKTFLLNPRWQLGYAGRAPSSVPAVGSPRLHTLQQTQLVNEALKL